MIFVVNLVFRQPLFTTGAKYAGLKVSEPKRLRELKSENAKLKKLLAEKLIEVDALKNLLSKKW